MVKFRNKIYIKVNKIFFTVLLTFITSIFVILLSGCDAIDKNSIVGQISHPPLAKISKDDKLIYFTGTLKDSKPVNIAGINCYPTSVFSYNINTGDLKEVYTPSVASMIFDLNIKY